MKQLTCEMCGSTDLMKQEGVFVCQTCGMKYSVEEAKKMMIEGTVDVQGTVKVDNSAFVEKYLANARRAKQKEDWEETEKYYNMVEQNDPKNIEAVFYSAYAKAYASLQCKDIDKRKAAFNVFSKSISIIDDYFDTDNSLEQSLLIVTMSKDLLTMFDCKFVQAVTGNGQNGDIHEHYNAPITKGLFGSACKNFIESLQNIVNAHPETNDKLSPCIIAHKEKLPTLFVKEGCYVATCVYGSYDCPQVWTLRRYRDDTLGSTWYGRLFIRTYYAISPTLVKWFGNTNWFKKLWKGKLDRMVAKLQSNGVEDTPYEDKNW